MIGDTVIPSEESRKKAVFVINYKNNSFIQDKNLRETWVISGESGTLKTETALDLQLLLWKIYKIKVFIIHLDDYYFSWYNERNKIRKQKGIKSVGIKEIEWEKLHVIVNAFRRKELLRMEQIHRYCETDVFSTIDSKYIDILLFEGLFGGWLKKGNYSDFSIFLEGTMKQTEGFRKERGKEIINEFRKKVLIKESKDVRKIKKYADLVVPFKLKV